MSGQKIPYDARARAAKETVHLNGYFIKCLTWSQVAQAPLPPPAPKEVAEKPTYILMTVQVTKEALEANSSPILSPKCQNRRVVPISLL